MSCIISVMIKIALLILAIIPIIYTVSYIIALDYFRGYSHIVKLKYSQFHDHYIINPDRYCCGYLHVTYMTESCRPYNILIRFGYFDTIRYEIARFLDKIDNDRKQRIEDQIDYLQLVQKEIEHYTKRAEEETKKSLRDLEIEREAALIKQTYGYVSISQLKIRKELESV